MPVYHRSRLVHIHIPKTGGTAITEQLGKIDPPTDHHHSWIGSRYQGGRWFEYQHLSLRELDALSDVDLADYFVVAVVRDPYQRLLSDYRWRNSISAAYPNAPILPFDSFDTFIKSIPQDINENFDRHIQTSDQAWANFLIHVRPQYQYLLSSNKGQQIDHLIRFETIVSDMKPLFQRLGAENTIIKDTPRPDLKQQYTLEQIEILNDIYQVDFSTFGYSIR